MTQAAPTDPAYLAAVEALPLRPSRCTACKTDRLCVVVGPAWKGDDIATMPPPRFGCPECEVAPTSCFDMGYPEDDTYKGELCSAVLRSPLDPFFRWAPEPMREALARFGFGTVLDSHDMSDLRTLVVDGEVWVAEQTRLFVNLHVPAAELATVEGAIGLPAEWTTRYRLAGEHLKAQVLDNLGPVVEVTPPSALGLDPKKWDERFLAVGSEVLPLRQVRLVKRLYREVTWHVMGSRNVVVACQEGRPCAVLMPLDTAAIAAAWVEQEAEDEAARSAWINNAEAFIAALDPAPFGMGALHVETFVEEEDPEVLYLHVCDGAKRVLVTVGTDWQYPWTQPDASGPFHKIGCGGKIARALTEAHEAGKVEPPCEKCVPTGAIVDQL